MPLSPVSKEAFDAYLQQHGSELEAHTVTIADPPLVAYYAKGAAPPALMAKHILNRLGEPDEYLITK